MYSGLKLLSTDAKDTFLLNSKIPCGKDGDGDTARKSVRDILDEKHRPGLGPGRAAVIVSLLESDSIDAPCYDPVLCLNSL